MDSPAAAPAPGGQTLRAIMFVALAVTLFPVMNAVVKYLGAWYPPGQIVWVRYLSHMFIMTALLMPGRGLALFRANRPFIQLARSALLFTATLAYFFGLQGVELPVAAVIGFTAPLIVTMLSVPILKEPVGPRRWIAVLVGFAGATIVVRPWTADLSNQAFTSTLLILTTAVTYAIYQVMTRKVSADDTAETTIVFSGMVGCIAAAPLALPDMVWPQTGFHLFLFALIGVLGGVGHYFLTRGFALAEAALLAPFTYLQLVGAVIFGYVVFGYFPDLWTWVGALVIVSSGIYVAAREYTLSRARTEAAAMRLAGHEAHEMGKRKHQRED